MIRDQVLINVGANDPSFLLCRLFARLKQMW